MSYHELKRRQTMTDDLAGSKLSAPTVASRGSRFITRLPHTPITIPRFLYWAQVLWCAQACVTSTPMQPHPTLTYKGDETLHVRWTPAGFPLPYLFAKSNRQHWHHFSAVVPDDETVQPVWPTLQPQLLSDPNDPFLQGNERPLTVQFIEYQACPVLGCSQGATLDHPVTQQPSTFRYSQMAQHFYNCHMSAA